MTDTRTVPPGLTPVNDPAAGGAPSNREALDAARTRFPASPVGDGLAVFVVEQSRDDYGNPRTADLVAVGRDLPAAWDRSLVRLVDAESYRGARDPLPAVGERVSRLRALHVHGDPAAIRALAVNLNDEEPIEVAEERADRPSAGDTTRAELSGAVAGAALLANVDELADLAAAPGPFGARVRTGLSVLGCSIPEVRGFDPRLPELPGAEPVEPHGLAAAIPGCDCPTCDPADDDGEGGSDDGDDERGGEDGAPDPDARAADVPELLAGWGAGDVAFNLALSGALDGRPASDILDRLSAPEVAAVVAHARQAREQAAIAKAERAARPPARGRKDWTVEQLERGEAELRDGDLIEQRDGTWTTWFQADQDKIDAFFQREEESRPARLEAARAWIESTGNALAATWTERLDKYDDQQRGVWIAYRPGASATRGSTPRLAVKAAIAWFVERATDVELVAELGELDRLSEADDPFAGLFVFRIEGPTKAATRFARSLEHVTLGGR